MANVQKGSKRLRPERLRFLLYWNLSKILCSFLIQTSLCWVAEKKKTPSPKSQNCQWFALTEKEQKNEPEWDGRYLCACVLDHTPDHKKLYQRRIYGENRTKGRLRLPTWQKQDSSRRRSFDNSMVLTHKWFIKGAGSIMTLYSRLLCCLGSCFTLYGEENCEGGSFLKS